VMKVDVEVLPLPLPALMHAGRAVRGTRENSALPPTGSHLLTRGVAKGVSKSQRSGGGGARGFCTAGGTARPCAARQQLAGVAALVRAVPAAQRAPPESEGVRHTAETSHLTTNTTPGDEDARFILPQGLLLSTAG
jgi:hypothetical protein